MASHENAAISVHILCTPYNYAPVHSVTLIEAIIMHMVHVCLDTTATCAFVRMTRFIHMILRQQTSVCWGAGRRGGGVGRGGERKGDERFAQ